MDMTADTRIEDLQPTLQRLRAAQAARLPDVGQRLEDLRHLREVFHRRLEDMVAAVAADFGHRSRHETLVSDGMTVLGELDHLIKHTKGWAKTRRASVDALFLPARAEIRRVPLGVVGVISPWNYPVNLALIPLATAIAAGNHVYLKPSEHTPRSSEFLRALLAEVFPEDRVAVALGGADVAGAFSALPFDHLFFTGSTAVGRKVMAAAAPNLTPVTLELGGKSPALVAEGYPLSTAAARIASGKWLNAGQTCIAPDYVLVPHAQRDMLVAALTREIQERYPTLDDNPDLTRIINTGQYDRLVAAIDDARERGARIVQPVEVDPDQGVAQRLLPPTLVLDVPGDATLMQEEIFGPVLPIIGYDNIDEALAFIRERDRPLAFYHFDSNAQRTERVLDTVVAGGVTVNDTVMHIAQSSLPFGGVGPSGMGHYHGEAGFLTFTKLMPVFRQARVSGMALFKPPYKGLADRLVKFLTR